MIGAWRKAWHANTQGETDLLFPFGFVQLSSWGQPSNVRRDPNPIAVVRYVSNYHTHHHTHHRPHPYTTLHPRSPPDFTYKYIIQPTTALIANPMLCYFPPPLPPLRWAQRLTQERVQNTFMATAVDLAAFQGGCGTVPTDQNLCIHPGWKQPVGARLARKFAVHSTMMKNGMFYMFCTSDANAAP